MLQWLKEFKLYQIFSCLVRIYLCDMTWDEVETGWKKFILYSYVYVCSRLSIFECTFYFVFAFSLSLYTFLLLLYMSFVLHCRFVVCNSFCPFYLLLCLCLFEKKRTGQLRNRKKRCKKIKLSASPPFSISLSKSIQQ